MFIRWKQQLYYFRHLGMEGSWPCVWVIWDSSKAFSNKIVEVTEPIGAWIDHSPKVSVEIFSEPQNSKEKSQLSRLKRKSNFLLCTHFSIFLVKVSLEYFWPQNTYGQKYIFFHALHTHDVWKHCKSLSFVKTKKKNPTI